MSDDLAGLRREVDELRARVDRLTELVESPGGAVAHGPSPDEAAWRRLGLIEGERRTVSVVFADVSGFTALSEALDPEAVQLVMRDTMSLLAECVQAEGGTVEKFIGDAVCAIFGAPVAHADEPERAARACLAMHAALAERAATRPDLPPLTVHAGINTGPVIAGAVGDGSQFGVMGDTINTAARLMDLAGDGQTYVSAATARRLRRRFRLEDAGVHRVKGKAEPLSVAAVVGELSAQEREQARRLRAPLVGRDAEQATIRNLARRAASGDGALVLVVGAAGTGISRLAGEVASELAGEGWTVLRASARVQAETPLGLVASALGPLVDDTTEADVAAALLAGGVAAPHDFELALADLLTDASRRAPLLVLLDDVDDADAGSTEVVRYLTRATATERVLWLVTAERAPAGFDAAGGSDAVLVRLAPLTDEAIEALVEGLLPGALTPPQRRRMAQLAEGNAQFAVEIAHALVEDGVVVEAEPGRWLVVGDADHVAIPGSVAELIEARIDQLPTQARITLQDAAVIGQRFSDRLLARVATIPVSLDAALAELADAELVLPPADPDDLWAFRSRLVREVAYDSILKRRRPAAHRAVADALVELEPDRVAANADLLAHHLEESDDPIAAFPHLVEAADRAEFAYNFTGALERATRALRLRDRFPGRVDEGDAARLLQRVGTVKLVLGDESGLAELEEAAELLARVGPVEAVVGLRERVGWYLTIAGQADRGASHLATAAAVATAELTGAARSAALAAVATTRALGLAAADPAAGIDAAEAAAADARTAGDPFTEARALLVAGAASLWQGDASAAVDRFRACIDLAWAHVFGTLADRCGRWLVLALVDAGRYDDAIELAETLLARADDRGDPSVGCGVRAGLAGLWRRRGDGDAARTVALAALEGAEERPVAADAVAEARLVLAELAADAGDAAEALVQLAAVDELSDVDGWSRWRWHPRAAAVRTALTGEAGSTVPSS